MWRRPKCQTCVWDSDRDFKANWKRNFKTNWKREIFFCLDEFEHTHAPSLDRVMVAFLLRDGGVPRRPARALVRRPWRVGAVAGGAARPRRAAAAAAAGEGRKGLGEKWKGEGLCDSFAIVDESHCTVGPTEIGDLGVFPPKDNAGALGRGAGFQKQLHLVKAHQSPRTMERSMVDGPMLTIFLPLCFI